MVFGLYIVLRLILSKLHLVSGAEFSNRARKGPVLCCFDSLSLFNMSVVLLTLLL